MTQTDTDASTDRKAAEQRALARILFLLETPPLDKEDLEASRFDRQASWKEQRPEFLRRARKLRRLIDESNDVSLIFSDTFAQEG